MGRVLVASAITLAMAAGALAAWHGARHASRAAEANPELFRVRQGFPGGESFAAMDPTTARS